MRTDTLVDGFRTMLRIRQAEEALAADFRERKIFSFIHLSTGQEAVAAGVCLALRRDDRVFGTHRSHGHYLAKGGDLYRMLAEIYGKADGCAKGRGGSMHLLDRSAGFMGSTPILGSVVPIATGSAFAQKAQLKNEVTAVFFGDGASEEGVVYESLNLAALFKLPILYVMENNLYAVNSPEEVRRSSSFNRKMVVEGLGVKYLHVDGNDFGEVYRAVESMRPLLTDVKPVFLEALCFRHHAHSGPIDDESVRRIDIKPVRDEHDPIKRIMADLARHNVSGVTLDRVLREVQREVQDAMRRAREAREPSPDDQEPADG